VYDLICYSQGGEYVHKITREIKEPNLQDDVIDEEVGCGGKGRPDARRNLARIVNEDAQLAEDGASQHGPQEHIEHVPHVEDDAYPAVQVTQRGGGALLLRNPAS